MRRTRFALVALILLCTPAFADSTHVALHATAGATTITVFTTPDPLVPGPVNIGVLLEDTSGAPVVDAAVEATLAPQADPARATRLVLAHAAGSSLFTAFTSVPAPGAYRLQVSVQRPAQPAAVFAATLAVESNTTRRVTLVVALFFPLLVIVLFLANQHLKAARRASKS